MAKKSALKPHCPKNKLDLRLKAEPVTDGVIAAVYIWHISQTYTVASAPSNRLGFLCGDSDYFADSLIFRNILNVNLRMDRNDFLGDIEF